MSAMLEIENLSLVYEKDDQHIHALNQACLTMEAGESLAIVGESGCGKSTLAKAVVRLLPETARITQGEVFYQGQAVGAMDDEQLRSLRGKEIGMIFQNPMTALNPVTKLKDQIYEVLKEQGLSKKEMQDRAIELYQMVGIPAPEKRLNEYIHEYSGGMRQRAMIAIVLASNPKLLIADEPTTALDVTIQSQILHLFKTLRKEIGMGILLISHDLAVASELCDRIAVMYAGQIVEVADRETIFGSPAHPYTKGLLDSLPEGNRKERRLKPIAGMPPKLEAPLTGCAFAERCPYATKECRESIPQMKEVEAQHFAACFLR